MKERVMSIAALKGQGKKEDFERILSVCFESDNAGNFYATKGEGETIALIAHRDTVSFIVTYAEEGFAKLSPVGGISPKLLYGEAVEFLGVPQKYGVFCSVPLHLQDEVTKPSFDELWVCCDGILPLGTRAVYKERPIELLNDRIASPVLDNSVGVIVAAEAFLRAGESCGKKIMLILTNGEELGLRGAKSVDKDFDKAIIIDVTFGEQAKASSKEAFPLRSGAMIGKGPVLDSFFSDELVCIAEEKKINYGIEPLSGGTGTDADAISILPGGVRCAMVSIPLRYMHSQSEVVDILDIADSIDLIVSYLEGK